MDLKTKLLAFDHEKNNDKIKIRKAIKMPIFLIKIVLYCKFVDDSSSELFVFCENSLI